MYNVHACTCAYGDVPTCIHAYMWEYIHVRAKKEAKEKMVTNNTDKTHVYVYIHVHALYIYTMYVYGMYMYMWETLASIKCGEIDSYMEFGNLVENCQISQAKERDMVLKNTELSFRVRTLEEQKTELEKYKRELVSASVGVLSIQLLEKHHLSFLCRKKRQMLSKNH